MSVAVVVGTRPELIKMAPVVQALDAAGQDPHLVHSGQHYSHEMDQIFFDMLGLPEPLANLAVGSGPHGRQTGLIMERLDPVLQERRWEAVLVQGDTNTVLAGALVAAKLHIPVGHVEAGLRSFDRTMPEELNRIVADHVSAWCFAPTEGAAAQLRAEGVSAPAVHVTGNTIVDAVHAMADRAEAAATIHETMRLARGQYILLTAHRQENVDDAARFAGLLAGAAAVGKEVGLPVVYPIHPRARKMMERFGLHADGVQLCQPVGFLDFVALEQGARLILTDSGGVQEEACILGVPCVTLRDNTERPETVAVGANRLAGVEAGAIQAAARAMLHASGNWKNPFGDGTAGKQIATIVAQGLPDEGFHPATHSTKVAQ